jgi:hypothetical protein
VFATKLPSPKLTVTKPSPSSHTADHSDINIVEGIPVLAQLKGLWVHVFDSKAEADKVEQNFRNIWSEHKLELLDGLASGVPVLGHLKGK